MNFDPQKPFGSIRGTCSQRPKARYQQGKYFYDAHRRCLNADEVKVIAPTVVATATADLKTKAAEAADTALIKMQKAKKDLDVDATPAKKTAFTKAKNVYEAAQAKLEELSE